MRRDGSMLRPHGAEERIVHKRIFGDNRQDSSAFMRLCNVINCVIGRFDEYVAQARGEDVEETEGERVVVPLSQPERQV